MVSMETTTEVTYHCTIGRVVLCEETGTLYFPAALAKTRKPAEVREFAAMLNDIAAKMEVRQ